MTKRHLLSFLEMMKAERAIAHNTLVSYEFDLENFFHHITPLLCTEATTHHLTTYLQTLAQSGLSAKTQSRHLSALRQFYRYLLSEDFIAHDPTFSIDTPKLPKSIPKTLTFEIITQLIEAAATQNSPQGLRMAAMLELLYATGLRVSEMVGLPMWVFPACLRDLATRPYLIILGKGKKERLVPLTARAIEAIEKYYNQRSRFLASLSSSHEKFLFPSRSKEGHLTRHRFFQLLKELAVKIGLDPSLVSPHVIRHAFATHLLAGGADLLAIQKLLGHADISTTQLYTHLNQDSLRELVLKHHPLADKNQQNKKL